MLEAVSNGINSVLDKFKTRGRLTDKNIEEGLKEIRVALLEADVSYKVVKDFIKNVKEKSLGEKVIDSIKPGQQIVKIVSDELTALMGKERREIYYNTNGLTVLMLVGLQGCGKTTTAAKLANLLKKEGKKVMLAAADLQRPAAVEQLCALGRQIEVPVYSEKKSNPVRVCRHAVKAAAKELYDIIILDTAGRLHVDKELMKELSRIKKKTDPHEILFVCDAMIGQDAVNSAKAFHDELEFDGVVLTKLDGDARGGAALSINAITGKPIKYVGVSEKMEGLETFFPDRMTSRILGMGDIVSMVEKAQEVMDEEKAEKFQKKFEENAIDLEDFMGQLQQIKKMGSIKDILGMIPGLGSKAASLPIEDKDMLRIESIIQSMTKKERKRPDIIDASRRKRIADGCGALPHDINNLVKQFKQMKKMMKRMNKMGGPLRGLPKGKKGGPLW